ncbi:MAG: gamma-glutamyl-gamma-aminobutyrate hydrolase family protein [Verrucomicrobia bacterium]|nr:gamma-glutamyl-gamma-aminobutyrate hydrolase family protein [Verrucomicrobiota bacterium]
MVRKFFIACLLTLGVTCGCGSPDTTSTVNKKNSAPAPLIGVAVAADGAKYERYCTALREAGGRPILIPLIEDQAELAAFIAQLDGVLLPGGADIPPDMYGEGADPSCTLIERTRAEYLVEMARIAMDGDTAVLGICLGAQVMNVARGGTLIQDIPREVPDALVHRGDKAMHDVNVVEGSRLRAITGAAVHVPSSHHQAVEAVGHGLVVAARSADGVIEAIELADRSRVGDRFVVGVQWHPELALDQPGQRALFRAFVEACRRNSPQSSTDSAG